MELTNVPATVINYAVWGSILMCQNISFTLVSRARNSASLRKHIWASVASNGVWFLSLMYMMGPMLDNLQGKNGWIARILTLIFYTVITVTGSVLAHKYSLITEKGLGAVGASKNYVQITKQDYADMMAVVEHAKQYKIGRVEFTDVT